MQDVAGFVACLSVPRFDARDANMDPLGWFNRRVRKVHANANRSRHLSCIVDFSGRSVRQRTVHRRLWIIFPRLE